MPDAARQTKRDISLLRFGTAGSVDVGKSTIIGRLLSDTKTVFEDQLAEATRTSTRKGLDEVDLALLMDGLKAEREQGITIDVAYRYFSTPKRKFIIADAPGHEQYTRNMVTGASTCELMLVIVDATKGVLTQSRRHTFIASLLQVPHIVVVVNKMDAVDYSQQVYEDIVAEFSDFVAKLAVHDVTFIPVSALKGDNIVEASTNMPWYGHAPLLRHLEEVYVASDRNLIDLRFPVQLVLRPNSDFRGYAGTVSSGVIRPGEEILVLPSGLTSKVKSIGSFDGELPCAFAGQSVVVTLEDEIDISRGDMFVRPNNVPELTNVFESILCWMNADGLESGKKYYIKHNSRLTRCMIQNLRYRIDVNTLHRERVESLALNEIGRACVKTLKPLAIDPYHVNRTTGSFVLIDPISYNTVAGGMIIGPEKELDFERIHAMESAAAAEFGEN